MACRYVSPLVHGWTCSGCAPVVVFMAGETLSDVDVLPGSYVVKDSSDMGASRVCKTRPIDRHG